PHADTSLLSLHDALPILTRSVYTASAAARSALGNRPSNSLFADAAVTVVLPVAAAARSLSACFSAAGSTPRTADPSAWLSALSLDRKSTRLNYSHFGI